MSDSDQIDVLDVLHEIVQLERSFYGTVRFFDMASRGQIVASHLRNTNAMVDVLRRYMLQPNRVTNMVLNIPLGQMDLSGNFFDPVTVAPSQQQIIAATERNVSVPDTTCAICQDSVPFATRIRACGHCFHDTCIQQWFSMSPRCPVCRHDIRDNLQTPRRQEGNESHRLHSDEE